MGLKLQLVPVPVSDVERAKEFYADQLGFHVDHDMQPTSSVRVVQLTPPGSTCSIALTHGLPAVDNVPGSLRGLHLVVDDIAKEHSALVERGVPMEEIVDLGAARYAAFADPDGNTWTLQEMTE